MQQKIVLFLSLFLSASLGWASCNLDKTGVGGNAWHSLPKGHLDATGARTLDDFVNATANQVFFTAEGSQVVVDGLLFMVGPFGMAGFAYKNPPPIFFGGHTCNEIGQCFQAQLRVTLSGQPDPLLNGLVGFISGGLIPGFNSEYFVQNYQIVVSDPEGNTSDLRDFRPSSIIHQQKLKERYSLSTDNQENVDMRCRDNLGNLTNDSPSSGGLSDNNEPMPWLWEINIPPPSAPAVWECWETETGVACRRIEPYPTFQ